MKHWTESELSQMTAKKRLHQAITKCEKAKALAEAHAKIMIRQARTI